MSKNKCTDDFHDQYCDCNEPDSNQLIEKSAEICARPWKRLAPNMNELLMKHIPVKSTQKEIFSFINELMQIRAMEIREILLARDGAERESQNENNAAT